MPSLYGIEYLQNFRASFCIHILEQSNAWDISYNFFLKQAKLYLSKHVKNHVILKHDYAMVYARVGI